MSPTPQKVLVVIPNYNGAERIEACLQSVCAQTYPSIEVVVVDNASQDGSERLIQKKFPQIRLIQSGYNSGWGLACNTGMHAAESDYIVLLNNDAYMEKNCVKEMVKAIEQNPRYGACASRILLWHEPEKAEVCGLVIYPDGSSCGRGRLGPAGRYLKSEEVFGASGCCNLYRRSMIAEVGDFDPDFFIYCDDTDISWRQQLAGWKCVYAPEAVAYHEHSLAAGSYSPFKAYHVERNRIFIAFKCFPWPFLVGSLFWSVWRYSYQCYLAWAEKKGALAHFQENHSLLSGLWLLIKAHLDAYRKLPVMWRRRREILGRKKISDGEVFGLFRRFGISTRQMAGYE